MCCKTLHKNLNENLKILEVFEFCYKIMSFRDLSKQLMIAPESSRNYPQHLEIHFMTLSHKIVNIYSYKQNCNESKSTPISFFLTSRSHTFSK